MDRRGITTTVTLMVLVGILVAGAVYGWQALVEPIPSAEEDPAASPTPGCTTRTIEAGQRIRSRQVQVSVFNGGTRSGLAGSTLRELEKRGFKPGEVGNAPSDVRVRKVQVWSTERNDPQAQLVAKQFGQKVRVRVSDVDLGPGVDVIVGDKFTRLVRATRRITVEEPREICVPNSPTASPTDADETAAGAPLSGSSLARSSSS